MADDHGGRRDPLPWGSAGATYRSGVTPERARRAVEGLDALREMLETGLHHVPPEERPALLEGLAVYEEHAERLLALAEAAAAGLELSRYEYDPELGDAKRVADPPTLARLLGLGEDARREGGTPLTQYSSMVGIFFEQEMLRHRRETATEDNPRGDLLPQFNAQAVREAIARKLRLFGREGDELDASYRGTIWKTLDNYLSKRRKRERKRLESPYRR